MEGDDLSQNPLFRGSQEEKENKMKGTHLTLEPAGMGLSSNFTI